jgi:hypothetical protein
MRIVRSFLWLGRYPFVIFFAVSGCDSCRHVEARRWALCTCEYITDMDYPGHVKLEACGEPARQSDVAKSCALASGVGAVMTCSCDASRGDFCRDDDMCRDVGR